MTVDGCSPQFFLLSLFPVFFRCFLLPLLHIRSIPMSLRYERLGSEFSLKAVLWRIVNDIELVHLFGFCTSVLGVDHCLFLANRFLLCGHVLFLHVLCVFLCCYRMLRNGRCCSCFVKFCWLIFNYLHR